MAFADAHRSDVVLPAVLSEGHTYTTREPVLENAVDVDPREAFLTLTPHKLFRRSYFDGLGFAIHRGESPLGGRSTGGTCLRRRRTHQPVW